MKNLIQAINTNNPTEVKNQFNLELGKRTIELINNRKKEIALSLFNHEVEDEETTTEESFIHKLKNVEENTILSFEDNSTLVVDKEISNKFVKLYESASEINKERLLNIAEKSKRAFLKTIQLTR